MLIILRQKAVQEDRIYLVTQNQDQQLVPIIIGAVQIQGQHQVKPSIIDLQIIKIKVQQEVILHLAAAQTGLIKGLHQAVIPQVVMEQPEAVALVLHISHLEVLQGLLHIQDHHQAVIPEALLLTGHQVVQTVVAQVINHLEVVPEVLQ